MNVVCKQRYVDHFTNGFVVYAFLISRFTGDDLQDLLNQSSLATTIPSVIAALLLKGIYSTNELVSSKKNFYLFAHFFFSDICLCSVEIYILLPSSPISRVLNTLNCFEG